MKYRGIWLAIGFIGNLLNSIALNSSILLITFQYKCILMMRWPNCLHGANGKTEMWYVLDRQRFMDNHRVC